MNFIEKFIANTIITNLIKRMEPMKEKLAGYKFIIVAVVSVLVMLTRWAFGEMTIGSEIYPAVTFGELMEFTRNMAMAIFAKLAWNRSNKG